MKQKKTNENFKLNIFRTVFVFLSVFAFFNILQNTSDYFGVRTDAEENTIPVVVILPAEKINTEIDKNADENEKNDAENDDNTDEGNTAFKDDDINDNDENKDEKPADEIHNLPDENTPQDPEDVDTPEIDYEIDITPISDGEKQAILNDIEKLPLIEFDFDNYFDLFKNTILQYDGNTPQEYEEDLYMIGDSITKGLWEYNLFPKERIYAEIGVNVYSITRYPIVETEPNVKIKAIDAIKQSKPSKIIITLGTNEIEWMTPKQFINYYSKFLDQIAETSPDSAVILQAVPPIKQYREKEEYNNRKINYYNFLILNLAKKKNVYFLNSCQILKDEDGYLQHKYDDGDGIHISEKAYVVWLDYILSHPAPSK